MTRRQQSPLEELVDAPWWISVVLAAVSYVVIRFGLPLLAARGGLYASLFEPFSSYAWVSAIFLVPAVVSAIRSAAKRRQLDRQTGIESIRALPWKRFEELLGEAYRRQGFSVLENPGMGTDGGIDLTIRRDGATYLVQCKQWRTYKVGVKVVREMLGLVTAHGATGAIVVTSGVFTKEARDFAASQSVELVDGDDLVRLIGDVQSSASIAAPVHVAQRRICPQCGQDLVLRQARRGPQAGSTFWGCSGYPQCKHTEPAAG